MITSMAMDADEPFFATQNVEYYDPNGVRITEQFSSDWKTQRNLTELYDYYQSFDNGSDAITKLANNDYAVIFIGGGDWRNNHPKYYDVMVDCYTKLTTLYNIPGRNIYLLYADGDTTGTTENTYKTVTVKRNGNVQTVPSPATSDMSFATVNGSKVKAATNEQLNSVFTELSGKMNDSSHLLFYVYDHGGDYDGCDPTKKGNEVVCGWEEILTGPQIRDAVFKIQSGYVTTMMGSCYGGGILAQLFNPSTGAQIKSYKNSAGQNVTYQGHAHFAGGSGTAHFEVGYSWSKEGQLFGYPYYFSSALTSSKTTQQAFATAKAGLIDWGATPENEVYANNEGTFIPDEEGVNTTQHPWHVGEDFPIFTNSVDLDADQYEPNDYPTLATELNVISATPKTITAYAEAMGNYDYYKFTLPQSFSSNDYFYITFDAQTSLKFRVEEESGWGWTITSDGSPLMFSMIDDEREYYLRVACPEGVNAVPYTFSIATAPIVKSLSPVFLSVPENGVKETSVVLTWNSVQNASGYTLQVRKEGENSWSNVFVNRSFANCSYTASGLESNTQYHFRMKAVGDGSEYADTDWSNVITVTTTQRELAAPTLTLGTTTPSTIAVTWKAVGGADGYRVEYKKANESDSAWRPAVESTGATNFVVSTLDEDTNYHVRVRALANPGSKYGDSPWSATLAAKTTKPTPLVTLAAPTLSIVAGQTTSTSFQATWNSVDHAVGYALQLKSAGAADSEYHTVATNLVDTKYTVSANLTPGASYDVRVQALAEVGSGYATSAWSAAQRVVTLRDKLVAPTLSVVDATAGTITVSWRSSSSGIASYTLAYRKVGVSGWTTALDRQSQTTKIVSNLEEHTPYEFRVMAHSANSSVDDSDWSVVQTGQTLYKTALDAPTISVDSVTPRAINLTWTASPNAAGYALQYKTSGSSTWSREYSTTATSYSFDDMTPETVYNVRVKAVAPAGGDYNDSAWTSKNVSTPADQKLAAPTITFDSKTSYSISLKWNAIASATGYQFEYRPASESEWRSASLETDSTSILLSALDANTTYYYRVKALASLSENDSNWSSIKSATTNQKIQLSAPTNLTVENVGSRGARLLWNNEVVDGCRIVVEYKKADESSWSNIGESIYGPNSEGKYYCQKLSSLNPETTYDFRLRHVVNQTFSDYVDSENSNVVTITTPSNPPTTRTKLDAPALSGYALSDSSVSLSGVNATHYDDSYSYIVQYKKNDDVEWTNTRVKRDSSLNAYVCQAVLSPNVTYQFRAKRQVKSGYTNTYEDSDWSQVVSIKTLKAGQTLLETPEITQATRLESGSIKLEWTSVPNAVGYTLENYLETVWTPVGSNISSNETLISNPGSYRVKALAGNSANYADSLWNQGQWGLGSYEIRVNSAPSFSVSETNLNSLELTFKNNLGGYPLTIEYRQVGGSSWTTAASSITGQYYNYQYLLEGLQANSSYEIRAKLSPSSASAFDVESAWTTITASTTTPAAKKTSLVAPDLVAEQLFGNIRVSWTETPHAETYTLEYRKAGELNWKLEAFETKALEHTTADLEPGATYEFRVKALPFADSNYQASEWSSSASYTVPDAVVHNEAKLYDRTKNSVSVDFLNTAGSYDILKIQYKKAGDAEWQTLTRRYGVSNAKTISDLEPDTSYWIRLKCNDENWTNVVVATTLDETSELTKVNPPSLSVSAVAPYSVTLDGMGDVVEYRKVGDSVWKTLYEKDLTSGARGLEPNTSYQFRSKFQNYNQYSDYSTTISATTPSLSSVGAVWTVTTTEDSETNSGSIRYIYDHAANGDVVQFASSLKGKTITLSSNLPYKDVYVDASSIFDSVNQKPGITINANGEMKKIGGAVFKCVKLNNVGVGSTSSAVDLNRCVVNITMDGVFMGGKAYISDSLFIGGNFGRSNNNNIYGVASFVAKNSTLVDCTVYLNWASQDNDGRGYDISNSILPGTTIITDAGQYANFFFRHASCRNSFIESTFYVVGQNNFSFDPTLPLFVNSSQGDYRLASNSQAIGKGDSTCATSTDLTGKARNAGLATVGAYDTQQTGTVWGRTISITGEAKVGSTLAGALSSGSGAASYQWYRVKPGKEPTWTAISGATSASYTPTSSDVGYYIGVVAMPASSSYTGVTSALSAETISPTQSRTWTVTTTVDSATNSGSLRYILENKVADGDKVVFSPSLKGATITLNSTISFYHAVTIDATALFDQEEMKPGITISGKPSESLGGGSGIESLGGGSGIFKLIGSAESERAVVLSGLTLTGANGTLSAGEKLDRNRIMNCEAAVSTIDRGLIVDRCFLPGNISVDVNSYEWTTGPILSYNSDVTITNTIIYSVLYCNARSLCLFVDSKYTISNSTIVGSNACSIGYNNAQISNSMLIDLDSAQDFLITADGVRRPYNKDLPLFANEELDQALRDNNRTLLSSLTLQPSDFQLAPYSQALNRSAADGTGTAIDFAGNPRVAGGALDIGAFESQTSAIDAIDAPSFTVSATAGTIEVSWSPNPDAVFYELTCGDVAYIVDGSESSFKITGLDASTQYNIQLRALGDGVAFFDSEYSTDSLSTTALRTLGKPAITGAVETDDSITVSWRPIEGATSYRVAYAPHGSTSFQTVVVSAATSYTLGNLATGSEYDFKVAALGDGIETTNSGYGAVSSFTSGVATPCSVTTYDPETRQATFEWRAIAGAAKYTVKLSKDGGATWSNYKTGLTTTSLTVNGLYAGKAYGLRVVGVSSAGTTVGEALETAFAPVAVTTPVQDYTVGTPIVVSLAAASNATATVRWYFVTNSGDVEIVSARDQLSYTPTTADYDVKIVTTGSGDSAPCVHSLTISRPIDAAPITVVRYDADERMALIKWDAMSGAEKYTVKISRDGGATWLNYISKISNKYNGINGIYAGKSYDFRIYGITSAGETLERYAAGTVAPIALRSSSSSYTVGQAITVAQTGAENASATIKWYNVTASGDVEIVSARNQLTYTPTTVAGDIKVVATGTGDSKGSVSTLTFTAPEVATFEATIASYDSTTRQATLQWTELPGAAKYTVKLSKNGGATWTNYKTGVTTTSATINGLYAGQTYAFRVYGVTSDGATITTSYAERPFAPIALTSTSDTYSPGVAITVTQTGASTATSTIKWYNVTPSGDVEITSARNSLTYTPPTTSNYDIKVVATGTGDSEGSSTTLVFANYSSIRIVSYDSSTRQATLSWGAIPGAATYKLQLSKDGGATWTNYKTGLTTLTSTVNGLYVGKTYGFRVYGVASSGTTLGAYYEKLFAPTSSSSSVVDEVFADFFADELFEEF
ncbi:MAG: fibronectin type III domain-containing protein [Thermoguttaceae bacterium]|nr:fibronectin type III domain-containing protein [Thermoguttaceae bacterium]